MQMQNHLDRTWCSGHSALLSSKLLGFDSFQQHTFQMDHFIQSYSESYTELMRTLSSCPLLSVKMHARKQYIDTILIFVFLCNFLLTIKHLFALRLYNAEYPESIQLVGRHCRRFVAGLE